MLRPLPEPFRAVVGLGANLGDRLQSLRAAAQQLALRSTVEATSLVYEAAPVGPPQPHFLNAAALVRYEGLPEALLDDLLDIERGLGRVRAGRWGPRTIDLDILWIEGVAVNTRRLVVPHPRLVERAFALAPMLALVPEARDPHTGVAYAVPPGDVRPTSDRL
ncbi:MAG: 2-amino-4-hydroxy-6-hydroxymethyldihydropteridine diphosphokinase [Polyangiaceae bacterium]